MKKIYALLGITVGLGIYMSTLNPILQYKVKKLNPGNIETSKILSKNSPTNRIDVRDAQRITRGDKKVIIAVIDTGADLDHKDLKANLWQNPGETGRINNRFCKSAVNKNFHPCDKSKNGIDDDSNGYIDDVNGWDFVYNSSNPVDHHGHGTHVLGTIAANGNVEQYGVKGVAPNVTVMMLKYYDPKLVSNHLKNTVHAIRYAIKMHANIINYSGGGTDFSTEEYDAIKEAKGAGILFVAAAGNEHSASDEVGKQYFPADYNLSNIISVTGSKKDDSGVLSFANYGDRSVDISAPGETIYSTLPGNGYGTMSGTSMAAPFVSGVAALVLSINNKLTIEELKSTILDSADQMTTLKGKSALGRKLNAYRAVVLAKYSPWRCRDLNYDPKVNQDKINLRLPSSFGGSK